MVKYTNEEGGKIVASLTNKAILYFSFKSEKEKAISKQKVNAQSGPLSRHWMAGNVDPSLCFFVAANQQQSTSINYSNINSIYHFKFINAIYHIPHPLLFFLNFILNLCHMETPVPFPSWCGSIVNMINLFHLFEPSILLTPAFKDIFVQHLSPRHPNKS